MPARKKIAPELVAEGKYLYEKTLTPIHDICAKMGVSRSAFYTRVRELHWVWRPYSTAEAASAVSAPAANAPVAAQQADGDSPVDPPLPFTERLRRVIDVQMQVAERTLQVLGPASSAEAERTGRILALVSRTVQEITATAQGRLPADDTDDDSVPVDIDEIRYELARKRSQLPLRLFMPSQLARGAACLGFFLEPIAEHRAGLGFLLLLGEAARMLRLRLFRHGLFRRGRSVSDRDAAHRDRRPARQVAAGHARGGVRRARDDADQHAAAHDRAAAVAEAGAGADQAGAVRIDQSARADGDQGRFVPRAEGVARARRWCRSRQW
jgi:hypothetical protein